MAQLNRVEAELAFDFAQHFVTGGVPAGVPAGGKGNHRANEYLYDRCCLRLGYGLDWLVAHVTPGQSENSHGECSVNDSGQG